MKTGTTDAGLDGALFCASLAGADRKVGRLTDNVVMSCAAAGGTWFRRLRADLFRRYLFRYLIYRSADAE